MKENLFKYVRKCLGCGVNYGTDYYADNGYCPNCLKQINKKVKKGEEP